MKTATIKMHDSYFELVRRFPLVPIKNEKQYDAAVEFLNTLAVRDEKSLDRGEHAYLEALTQFVEDYEEKHHRIDTADMGPLDALKHLMEVNSMKAIDLGKILGSRSLASQVMSGKRALSKANIVALAQRFRVNPGLFL
jgi:HTH-type transcriptional regulator / antitoxin HigA